MSAREFLEQLYGDLSNIVVDEDQLRKTWSDPDQREKLLNLLEERGYDYEKLRDIRRLIDAPDSDLFDVLAYVRFALDPKTRTERADAVRDGELDRFREEMRDFLRAVLSAYEVNGVSELALGKLGDFLQVRYGSIADAKAKLGDVAAIRRAYIEMQQGLYRD